MFERNDVCEVKVNNQYIGGRKQKRRGTTTVAKCKGKSQNAIRRGPEIDQK